MVITTGLGRTRALAAARFAILVLACLFVAHTTIFLARYGAGEALATAMRVEGHDAYWPAFILVVGGGVAVLVVSAFARLWRLAKRAPRRHRSADGTPLPAFGDELKNLWPSLFGATTVLYAMQENIEHLAAQGHLPGANILWGPEGSFAIPGLLVVSLCGAAIGALVRWRTRVYAARIGRGREGPPPRRIGASRPGRRWTFVGATCALARIAVHQDAGRAPPARIAFA
jgi:purine-cytosine permease-like protein